MNLFDTVEAIGIIALDFTTAPKTIKMLAAEHCERGDYVVICRNDSREAGEYLAIKITDYDYEVIPYGNYTIFITHHC